MFYKVVKVLIALYIFSMSAYSADLYSNNEQDINSIQNVLKHRVWMLTAVVASPPPNVTYENQIISCETDSKGIVDSSCKVVYKSTDLQPMNLYVNESTTKIWILSPSTNQVEVCGLDHDGAVIKNSCKSAGSQFNSPYSMSLSKDGKKAWVSNIMAMDENSLAACDVNDDGSFDNCKPAIVGSDFAMIFGVTLNSEKNSLWFVLGNGTVASCSINAEGELVSCKENYEFDTQTTYDIKVNKDNSIAWVTNLTDGTVSSCKTNGEDGFGECVVKDGFNSPSSIAIDSDENGIWVQNSTSLDPKNDYLSFCKLDDNGVITSCKKQKIDTPYLANVFYR